MRTSQGARGICEIHERCSVRRCLCDWRFWITVSFPVVLAAAGTIYAYGRLNERVDTTQEKVTRLENMQRETHDLVKEMHGMIKARGIVVP